MKLVPHQNRRHPGGERIDELLLTYVQLLTVDRMIDAAGERLLAGMSRAGGAEPVPAFMNEAHPVATRRALARLHAYRRRLRGAGPLHRPAVPYGLPDCHVRGWTVDGSRRLPGFLLSPIEQDGVGRKKVCVINPGPEPSGEQRLDHRWREKRKP